MVNNIPLEKLERLKREMRGIPPLKAIDSPKWPRRARAKLIDAGDAAIEIENKESISTPTVTAPAATTPSNPATPQAPASTNTPLAACWRYAGNEWRRLPGDITLNACAQQLFGGRCEKTGGATYGRWGEETLRLVPGRVEISSDNRSFHTAFDQGPNCSIPNG